MSPVNFRSEESGMDKNFEDWIKNLDSDGGPLEDMLAEGRSEDRLSRLAVDLHNARPKSPPAPQEFKQQLRARLVNRYTDQPQEPVRSRFWGWALNFGGLAVLAMILFLAITQIPNSVPLAQLDPLATEVQSGATTPTPTNRTLVAGAKINEPQWLLFNQNTQTLFGHNATTTGGWRGVENVFIAHYDGKMLRPVVDGPEKMNWLVDVAPSGQRILLAAGEDRPGESLANFNLYSVEVSGGKPVLISDTFQFSTQNTGAYWLADGERLVLLAQDKQGPGVFLTRRDGSEWIRLSPPGLQPATLYRSRSNSNGVFWREVLASSSSDNSELAVDEGVGALWWSALDGSGTLRAMSDLPDELSAAPMEFVVSPDGKSLAFSRLGCLADPVSGVTGLSESCRTLYMSDERGTSLTRRVFDGWPQPHAWSPDGSELAVSVTNVSLGEKEAAGVSYELLFFLWRPGSEPQRLPVPVLTIPEIPAKRALVKWAADGLRLLIDHSLLELPVIVELESLEAIPVLQRAASWQTNGRPWNVFWGPAIEPDWKIDWFAPDKGPYPSPPGVDPDQLPEENELPYPYPYPEPQSAELEPAYPEP